jgi:hypothetical protein
MNLVSPFKKRWQRPGLEKESDQFFEESPMIGVPYRLLWR